MTISFEVIALAALATALVAVIVGYAQNAKLRSQLAEQQAAINAMQVDVSAVCAGAVGLGEHLVHLEQRAHQLGQRQEKIEMQDPSSQSYRHAIKMMGKGADLEEVMADCGLARGEAELVALAQRIKKAS
jgi:hypothetical protein